MAAKWLQPAETQYGGGGLLRISRELRFQMRGNVRDDQDMVILVTQFQNVPDPVDLGNERGFTGWDSEARTQSPLCQCVLQCLHQLANPCTGASGNGHAAGKSLHISVRQFAILEAVNLVKND
jgi:hypothetical protein